MKKRNSRNRDVLGLAFHDSSRPLARQANNTLDMLYDEDKVRYEMRLNPEPVRGGQGDVSRCYSGARSPLQQYRVRYRGGRLGGGGGQQVGRRPGQGGENRLTSFEADQIDIVEVSLWWRRVRSAVRPAAQWPPPGGGGQAPGTGQWQVCSGGHVNESVAGEER